MEHVTRGGFNIVPIQSLKQTFFEGAKSGDPSTKVLGYFRIVRFADGNRFYFLGKSSWNIHREENQTRDPQS